MALDLRAGMDLAADEVDGLLHAVDDRFAAHRRAQVDKVGEGHVHTFVDARNRTLVAGAARRLAARVSVSLPANVAFSNNCLHRDATRGSPARIVRSSANDSESR